MKKSKGSHVPRPVQHPSFKRASQAPSQGPLNDADLKRGHKVVGRPGVLESPKGKRKA